MLLSLNLPLVNPIMTDARIDAIHARAGAELKAGSKILDLMIDLSTAVAHDCPPISYYRLVAREHVWLCRLHAEPGDRMAPGALIALFSTSPEEDPEIPPSRPLRVSVAGIIKQEAWPES